MAEQVAVFDDICISQCTGQQRFDLHVQIHGFAVDEREQVEVTGDILPVETGMGMQKPLEIEAFPIYRIQWVLTVRHSLEVT